MGETRGIRGVGAGDCKILGHATLDENGIPAWATFTRGAGAWSTQTAVALNGTTFIVYGTSQNTARYQYVPSAGRRMLILEPTRATMHTRSNFVDTTPSDDVPDGWTASGGVAGVTAWVDDTAGPHGGAAARLGAALEADKGYRETGITVANATTYTSSLWVRTAGAMPAGRLLYGHHTGDGYVYIALPTGAFDWTRCQVVGATVAETLDALYSMNAHTDALTVETLLALPQCEIGSYASTWIPSAGAVVTRAAELCAINAAKVGCETGFVEFLWSPLYASTAFTTVATLFEWAPNWRLDYDGTGDTLKVVVNGTTRATSAALTFSAGALMRVSVRYSSSGQWLTVNGVTTNNTTSWGVPTLAPYLGSRAASANCESAAYADLLLAA